MKLYHVLVKYKNSVWVHYEHSRVIILRNSFIKMKWEVVHLPRFSILYLSKIKPILISVKWSTYYPLTSFAKYTTLFNFHRKSSKAQIILHYFLEILIHIGLKNCSKAEIQIYPNFSFKIKIATISFACTHTSQSPHIHPPLFSAILSIFIQR